MQSRFLPLLALCALGIAQPLLDLIGANAGFLVAHRMGPWEVGLLAFALLVGLPLGVWLLVAAAGRIHEAAGTALMLLLVAALSAATVLAPLARDGRLGGVAAVILAGSIGCGVAWAYRRFPRFERALGWMSLGPVVFGVAFFSNAGIQKLVREHYEPVRFEGEIATPAPVVLVVFDALPMSSLLDASGRIDPVRYPAFSAFAQQATWFPYAAALSPWTLDAVPAILTGRPPERDAIATLADHPRNLFTLLEGRYDLHVREEYTALMPGASGQEVETPFGERMRSLVSDLAVLYVEIVIPRDVSPLPPLDMQWKDFAGWRVGAAQARVAFSRGDPAVPFRRFVAQIRSPEPGARPPLHYLHALLPHGPYRHMPTGLSYEPHAVHGKWHTWSPEPWWSLQGYQRHLLQLEFTDRLFGELVARLDRSGIFDPALVIVMADHGNSFWAGSSERDPTQTGHPEDIVGVPLLVKTPGQRAGRVDERFAVVTDVLPTIADVLGLEIPWEIEGCSLLRSDCPPRSGARMVESRFSGELRFDRSLLERHTTLDRKLRLFGDGSRSGGLFDIGPYPALHGRDVADLAPASTDGVRARLNPESFLRARRAPRSFGVARLTGTLELPPGARAPEALAFAVRGTIRATAPLVEAEGLPDFSAMLPEPFLPGDPEEVAIFAVRGSGDAPRLERLQVD